MKLAYQLHGRIPCEHRSSGFGAKHFPVQRRDASGSGDPVHADTVVNSSENILSTANVPDNSALADVQELHNTGVSVVWPSDAPIKLQRLRHKNEVSFPMSPN